jgi:hypothetical protein
LTFDSLSATLVEWIEFLGIREGCGEGCDVPFADSTPRPG